MKTLAGIFIGGSATRYDGAAKGLLPAPDGSGTLVARLVQILGSLEIPSVLVGTDHRMQILGLPMISDGDQSAPGPGDSPGPIGGFVALYAHALAAAGEAGPRTDPPRVLALACDMPFLTSASITRLVACPAPLAAARRDERWEPFFSIHAPHVMLPRARARIASGRRSLQGLFDGTGPYDRALEVPVDAHELDDWDSPADRARTMPIRTMS